MNKKNITPTSRKADVLSLQDGIEDLLNVFKLKGKFNETHIIASWERIMGTPIANRTLSIDIRNSKMYVKLTSAALKQELNMSKTKVLELLHQDLSEKVIEEIYFM